MKPRTRLPLFAAPSRRTLLSLVLVLTAIALLSLDLRSNAQSQVQVTAADPPAASQGTINLNVRVTGKGFKNGAKAKWFVTGTTDPGGVTVNSTTFVSSAELTANITVADTAIVANYDIQVLNSDGRGGKGTELFGVTAKGGGNSSCPTQSPAPILGNCYSLSPGCLDTSFGSNGQVLTLPNSSVGNGAHTLLIQNDSKLVVAGNTNNTSTGTDFIVARYNVEGSLDSSFGATDPLNPSVRLGYNTVSFVSGDQFQDALLQPDGKIVVAGYTNIPSGNSTQAVMALARFDSDGTLDATFGNGGKVTGASSATGYPKAIAIQSDGKIVLAGVPYFGLARLNPNGSFDMTFGTSGLVSANPSTVSGGTGFAYAVAIQRIPAVTGEERIVVGGWTTRDQSTPSLGDFALMRFRPDGAIDTTFGNNGRVNTDFFGFADQIFDLTLDATNRILATGSSYIASDQCGGYVKDFGLARYLENGTVDLSLNSTGRQTADLLAGQDTGETVAVQADGRIVVAGLTYSGDNSIHDFGLVRFNMDGSRDNSFGPRGDGVVATDFSNAQLHYNYAYAVAVQQDGKIVVAGTTNICSGSGRNACRNSVSKIAMARYWP